MDEQYGSHSPVCISTPPSACLTAGSSKGNAVNEYVNSWPTMTVCGLSTTSCLPWKCVVCQNLRVRWRKW